MNADKLLVEHSRGAEFVPLADIIYCRAKDNWTTIALKGQTFFQVSQTLKTMEERINNKHFLRVHRSYLVNLPQIEKIHGAYNHLEMTDGQTIPVSRRRKNELKKALKIVMKLG
ncbi:MAG: LytR/AlgR family response regulator transcription factor [Bacteroidota bacterium]